MSLVLGSRPSKQSMPQKENATMTRNIASDDKWVFEVRGGVLLVFGERINLADGCWFGTEGDPFGPFATDQEALDAAASASDETAELNILATPSEPLPVTDPGEVVPLLRQRDETDLKIFQPVRSCRGALDRLRSRFEEATDALDQCDREHALTAGRRPTLLIYLAVCADEDTTGWPHEDLGNLRVALNALVRVFRL